MWYPVDQGVTMTFTQGLFHMMDAFKATVVIVINPEGVDEHFLCLIII